MTTSSSLSLACTSPFPSPSRLFDAHTRRTRTDGTTQAAGKWRDQGRGAAWCPQGRPTWWNGRRCSGREGGGGGQVAGCGSSDIGEDELWCLEAHARLGLVILSPQINFASSMWCALAASPGVSGSWRGRYCRIRARRVPIKLIAYRLLSCLQNCINEM